jgi:hypothetical protein
LGKVVFIMFHLIDLDFWYPQLLRNTFRFSGDEVLVVQKLQVQERQDEGRQRGIGFPRTARAGIRIRIWVRVRIRIGGFEHGGGFGELRTVGLPDEHRY